MFDLIDKATMDLIEDTVAQAIARFDEYAEQHEAQAEAADDSEAGQQVKLDKTAKAERNRNMSQFLADRLQAIKDSLHVRDTAPAPLPAIVELSDEEQHVLDWLSQNQDQRVGECGTALGRLLGCGLVELGPEVPGDEGARTVKITDKGRELVSPGVV